MTLSLRKQGDVFALPVPGRTDKGDREALYFDEGDPKISAHRLALRVRENGSRKWIYFYRWGGKQQRYTIGESEWLDARKGQGQGAWAHMLKERDYDDDGDVVHYRIVLTRQSATCAPDQHGWGLLGDALIQLAKVGLGNRWPRSNR